MNELKKVNSPSFSTVPPSPPEPQQKDQKSKRIQSVVSGVEVHPVSSFAWSMRTGYGNAGASKRKGSMKGYESDSIGPQYDIDSHNDVLRQRARTLYMAAPLATSAIVTNRTNVIGLGLQLKSRVNRDALGWTPEQAEVWQKKVESEWSLWANDKDSCDATGINDFNAMQQLAIVSWLVSGDVFGVVKYYESTTMQPYGLRIHLTEADRCSTPSNGGKIVGLPSIEGEADNGNKIFDGVEINNQGRIVAYHFSKDPIVPGLKGLGQKTDYIRIEARGIETGLPNVIHVMNSERPDQYRGVSYLAQVIEPLIQIGRYTDSELMAAVIESMLTGFVTSPHADEDEEFMNETGDVDDQVSRSPNEYEIGAGTMNYMAPGEDIKFTDPKRPSSGFDGFVKAVATQIGAALEVPADLLMKQFNASYSASRAALLEAWKAFKMRRAWFASDFCKPIYSIWLAEAVARGRIEAPGFFDDPILRAAYLGSEWIGPSAGQLDPVKEVQALGEAIHIGLTTHEQATIQYSGGSWDGNVEALGREYEKVAGIKSRYTPLYPQNEEGDTKDAETESASTNGQQ